MTEVIRSLTPAEFENAHNAKPVVIHEDNSYRLVNFVDTEDGKVCIGFERMAGLDLMGNKRWESVSLSDERCNGTHAMRWLMALAEKNITY